MADEARAQRQKALSDKKKRLEELKMRRKQRSEQPVSASETARVKIAASANLDDYIDGLLKNPAAAPSEASNAIASTLPTPTAAERTTDVKTTEAPLPNNVQAVAVPAPAAPPAIAVETFEMSTQVADEDFPPASEKSDDQELQQADQEQEQANEQAAAEAAKAEKEEKKAQEEAKVLTAEEVEKELASDTFSTFLNTASKKVERVLGSSLLADLLIEYDGETDAADRGSKSSDGSKYVSSRQVYECPQWTGTRDITDMDWSPLHRELMLCSYHMPYSTNKIGEPKGSTAVKAVSPGDTPSDSLSPRQAELQSDGLALVWNLAMPQRPEHVFTCGSPVTSTRFHPTEAPLIVGGCQSGQVVVWDVRAGRMPVQKSSLTTTISGNSRGHTYPICAMQVIEGGAGLATGATDGRVNFWSLAALRDPVESLQVADSLSCLAMAAESETLVCGDEMGRLYTIQSNMNSLGGGGQRSKRKVAKLDPGTDGGHYGMISSVSTKTLKSSTRAGLTKGFLRGSGGLFLTAGVDWTVKLWGPAYTDKPLLSLVSHSYDYMSDVQWSPAHPTLMATASSNGTVGLWNFSQTLEEPITGSAGIVVEPDGGSGRGLNKLKWSSDGRRMLVASADRVHVLVLAEDVVRQKGDEDARMMAHITSRGLLDRK